MQNIKTLVLTLILLLIFIILIMLNIKVYSDIINKEKYLQEQLEIEKATEEHISKYYEETVLEEVTNRTTFYKLKSCTEKYFTTVVELWKNDSKEATKNLLNLLAKDYIEENKLTTNNIKKNFTYFEQEKVIISEAYQYNIKNGISMYLIKGNNICNDGTKKTVFNIIIVTDDNQETFEVYPEDYLKKHGFDKMQIGKKVEQFDDIEKIEKNNSNILQRLIITNEKIAQDYFDLYCFNMKYDIEEAYSRLDKEYAKIRFSTIQEFKEYVKAKTELSNTGKFRNYSEFENMEEYIAYLSSNKHLELKEYQVKREEQGTRYICIDNYNNYYIFYEKAPLNYTVMLDTYTINLPEYVSKYKNAEEKEKVVLNIKRFFTGIDDKNYGYSYSVLSEEFKNNKYPTKNDFVNYVKENFFEKNQIEYKNVEVEKGVYVYKIGISDASKNTSEEKIFNIIVKLNSEADFEISFGEN